MRTSRFCFQVPANRIGYGPFSAYQLKILQEALVCLMAAVAFAFWHA
jgi:hypothetical protein